MIEALDVAGYHVFTAEDLITVPRTVIKKETFLQETLEENKIMIILIVSPRENDLLEVEISQVICKLCCVRPSLFGKDLIYYIAFNL